MDIKGIIWGTMPRKIITIVVSIALLGVISSLLGFGNSPQSESLITNPVTSNPPATASQDHTLLGETSNGAGIVWLDESQTAIYEINGASGQTVTNAVPCVNVEANFVGTENPWVWSTTATVEDPYEGETLLVCSSADASKLVLQLD